MRTDLSSFDFEVLQSRQALDRPRKLAAEMISAWPIVSPKAAAGENLDVSGVEVEGLERGAVAERAD